ncbi:ATP-binding cassette domain-containing protein [Weeksellaceae bacterium TAE3-ERU29]|nr:ATP-binding cassette domain-containing protein [Weeksellaceae bacterium TAE3-ERU29]
MNKPIISLENITFAYDETPIIKDFSYQIPKGSFLCITGESGCGKSTLLRIINGLLIPQKGEVEVCGTPLQKDNVIELRRKMGYILQENSLFPHFTAYQNMVYCLDLLKTTDEEKQNRIKELLPLVNLKEDILAKFPHELSGGQRQRVGIVRAIAHRPEIVLMDEPFSALDPKTREQLQDLVKDIHKKTHTTFVMVTHSPDEAEKLGTEVLKM